ncbi:MAG TPA: FliH/SctL family protein [Burkholderiaceae bacterium]|nr:FliH/SctL family protein [Burkholderiaceae bacterium]
MNFIALHRGSDTSLGTCQWLLQPDDITACESSMALLSRLQDLHDRRKHDLEEAVTQGREAGFAAGRDEALREVVPTLLAAWQQAAHQGQADLHALRQAVVTLSRHVVERIAAGLAPADVVAALARRAVQELVPPRAAVVRVHPDVAAAVHDCLHAAEQSLDAASLEVRADSTLGLLDCELDTPAGQLIASLQTQLDQVTRALCGTQDGPR